MPEFPAFQLTSSRGYVFPTSVRTMCPAYFTPDHSRSLCLAVRGTVDVRDALAEVPLRVFGAVDALEREEADVGVRVALAALVADVAALYINYILVRRCTLFGVSLHLRRWLFSEDMLVPC
jgi:hypothetical protein